VRHARAEQGCAARDACHGSRATARCHQPASPQGPPQGSHCSARAREVFAHQPCIMTRLAMWADGIDQRADHLAARGGNLGHADLCIFPAVDAAREPRECACVCLHRAVFLLDSVHRYSSRKCPAQVRLPHLSLLVLTCALPVPGAGRCAASIPLTDVHPCGTRAILMGAARGLRCRWRSRVCGILYFA
jgi:hypothetical protein